MAGGGGSSNSTSHDSLFNPGKSLNIPILVGLLTALIVFTVLFEKGLHLLEHALHDHATYATILSKVLKELAILGFLSFATLMTINAGSSRRIAPHFTKCFTKCIESIPMGTV